MRQWLRAWNITVSGGGGSIDLSELRCRFGIKQATTQAPQIGSFRIYNLSDATANTITQPGEFTEVTFSAGYSDPNTGESNEATIFVGEIKQFRTGKENPTDTFLDIFATASDKAYNFATVNKALPAGSTMQDHLNTFVEGFQKFGVGKGFISTLPTFKYPRGVSFFGMARDYTRTLANSAGMVWTILDGKVNMVKPTEAIPSGGPVIVNSTTGMIGIPVQTIDGILVRILINPQIKWHTQVQINQKDITAAQLDLSYQGGTGTQGAGSNQFPSIVADGIYTVVSLDINGDTRGTPWYYDLTCVADSSAFRGAALSTVDNYPTRPGSTG